jgi:hypothetical protein
MMIDAATREEISRLDQAVDDFAAEMKARLREQAMKGYRGWDNPENYERILQMMMKYAAVAEGEEVDAANLAMILWSMRRRRGGDKRRRGVITRRSRRGLGVGQPGPGTGASRILPWSWSNQRRALSPRPQVVSVTDPSGRIVTVVFMLRPRM